MKTSLERLGKKERIEARVTKEMKDLILKASLMEGRNNLPSSPCLWRKMWVHKEPDPGTRPGSLIHKKSGFGMTGQGQMGDEGAENPGGRSQAAGRAGSSA